MSYLIYINGKQVNEKAVNFARTLQVNDIANLTTRNSNFTQSIKIPRTSVNIPIFYNAFNVGNQSNIPYVKVDCNVIDADTGQHVIYKGWAVLLESTPLEYSITIYDGSIDFYRAIEKYFITDIGVSELNHVKNIDNIIETWNDTSLPYRYILADYNGNNESGIYPSIDFQVPCASVKYIWNKIFDFIGWTYEGSIFTHEKFTNFWLSYPKPVSELTPSLYLVTEQDSILTTNLVQYPIGNGIFYGSVTFANFFSDASSFNPTYYNVTTGIVLQGLYRFNFTSAIFSRGDNPNIQTTSKIQITVKDQLNQIVSLNYVDISLGNYIDILLDVGQRLFFTLVDSNNFPFNGFSSPEGTLFLTGTTFGTMNYVDGFNLGFDEAFINYKISDFVREIIVRFGLTPFKDKYTNKVTFLTLYELLQNTNIDNWETKFSRKLSEKYVFGSYAKTNLFKYKYNDDGMIHNDGSFTILNDNLPEQYVLLNSQIYSH